MEDLMELRLEYITIMLDSSIDQELKDEFRDYYLAELQSFKEESNETHTSKIQ